MKKSAVKTDKADLYQLVTDRVIDQLEKGVLPWRKTWSSFGLARNYVSGKPYKGINMLMMNFFVNHQVPYYLTFKQAKELGGNVRKGAKAERVIYFNMIFKDKDGKKLSSDAAKGRDDVKVMKFLRYFSVFNVEDIEGIDFTFEELRLLPNERINRCERMVQGYPLPPQYQEKDLGRAYYDRVGDYVNMPPIEQHESAEFYYSTYFHELVHSTGHESRLGRKSLLDSTGFGSESYSEEELVAEFGASFLNNIVGIDSGQLLENSASYIQGWLSKFKGDKQLVFKAAAEAQKAVDYILDDNADGFM